MLERANPWMGCGNEAHYFRRPFPISILLLILIVLATAADTAKHPSLIIRHWAFDILSDFDIRYLSFAVTCPPPDKTSAPIPPYP